MKKLFLTLAAFSALTFTAAAQNHAKTAGTEEKAPLTPEQRAEKETKNATEKLGLNADQQAKFKVYALDRVRSNRSLRDKVKTATPEEKQKLQAERKANNDKFFNNVNAMLDAGQQTKWAEHKKNMQERRDKNHHED